jgi:N-methylhydantoinase A
MAARIGIDTGGTFTDVVRLGPAGVQVHKLPSTPKDPARAVLGGLAAVRRRADEPVDVVHGTTVGLNAVLTGSLARTVLVTNRGCEDLVEIGRQERTDLYALAPGRPVPPVPRALRVGVRCRRGPGGTVVEPLQPVELRQVVARVRALAPQAIAIGLLHAPDDDGDERTLAAALAAALPDVPITRSAELAPVRGEYERFTAAILNAAIAPVVGAYTARLQTGVGAGRLRLLRSSLGILPVDEARAFPARAMFSGPAGGVLATAQLARRLRFPRVAALDIGGTSADLCLCDDDALVHEHASIGGLPLPLPSVPVHTVGCGGGSLAYADAGGALRVGPQSAGADPGPACYGRGGDATVTDAHVVLGHLGEATLLGGGFPIDVDAAVRALERLGRRLGLGAVAAARGVLAVADATMARAILAITAERAIDPAQVPLIAYGGAGGLHACALADRLGLPAAVVPPLPGAFSALGLALAGDAIELGEALHVVLTPRTLRELLRRGERLQRRALAGIDARAAARAFAHVRYRGQGASLRLPLGGDLAARFAREHDRRYAFTMAAPLEVVRLTARAETRARPLPAGAGPASLAARGAGRNAGAGHGSRRAPSGGGRWRVHERDALRGTVSGPAIVEEPTATTVIPAGWVARPGRYGLQLVRRRR